MECRGIRVEGALESTLDALREVAGSIPALPSSSRNAARPFSLDKLQSVRSSSLTCVTPLFAVQRSGWNVGRTHTDPWSKVLTRPIGTGIVGSIPSGSTSLPSGRPPYVDMGLGAE